MYIYFYILYICTFIYTIYTFNHYCVLIPGALWIVKLAQVLIERFLNLR
jgi:hypothetical protein